ELLATLLFFTAVRSMRRFRNPIVLNGSRLAFLAICLVPANLVRRELVHWSPAFIWDGLGRRGLLALSLAISAFLLWGMIRKPQFFTKVAVGFVLFLSPLAPIIFARV